MKVFHEELDQRFEINYGDKMSISMFKLCAALYIEGKEINKVFAENKERIRRELLHFVGELEPNETITIT